MSPSRRRHLKGLLRASAYLSVLGLVAGVFSIRAARAEVAERSVVFGRQMAELSKATNQDLNQITIDGQSMWVGSSTTKDSAKNVLDRYEGYCQTNAAQPGASWRELADKTDAAKAESSILKTGILRGGTATEGTILCFTHTNQSKPTLKESLSTLAQTGDLGALGSVRYVYAHEEGTSTIVLTAWTDEKFDILKLTPAEGKDVTGDELPEIPRPPETDRVLATRIERTPFGINAYRGKGSPASVVAFYDDAMQKKGWFALDPEIEDEDGERGKQAHQTTARLYEKDGVVLTVASRIDEGATFTHLGLAGVSAALEARKKP